MKRRAERQPPPAERPAPKGGPVTRRELVLLAVVVVIGVVLRLWAFSRSAVEHFDEGVYASNIYFDGPEYAYPLQRFYAPTLLPALIEAGMMVGLPPNVAALLPSFLAGCGTIMALWWFGRSWFGPPAGIAAAALIALNDFHVLYSAAALTDVLLGLWLVLAVDAMGRSLAGQGSRGRGEEKDEGIHSLAGASGWYGDFRWAIGAGIYTGLAWWTKYNGWLPLAIEGAALPLLWLLLRPPTRQLVTWLNCFAVTALVAAVAWSPYYLSLQSTGGYGPIAANHAKYFVGFAGWWDSASRQLANQFVIQRLPSLVSLALAMVLPALLAPRGLVENAKLVNLRIGVPCFVAAFLALLLTTALVAAVMAVVGIIQTGFSLRSTARNDDLVRCKLIGLALVAAWFGGMVLATPCYTAYPRLLLPLLGAAWIGASLIWIDRAELEIPQLRTWSGSDWKRLALLGGLWLAYCAFAVWWLPHEDHLGLVTNRRGLEGIAQRIRGTSSNREARAIHVFGEPALYFQLRAAGEEYVAPVAEIPASAATRNGQAIATYLAIGPHALRDPAFHDQWRRAETRWELSVSFDYQPSAIVGLDLQDPRRPASKDVSQQNQVRLYRLRP